MSQSVMQKDWFTVFKVKVTEKTYVSKLLLAFISSDLLIHLQTNLV